MKTVFALICSISLLSLSPVSALDRTTPAVKREKPNILLVLLEDWSLDLGCYGNKDLRTPQVDAFAAAGRKYLRAYATAPVCSPSRSALMTGFDQHTIGAQQHRTQPKKPLPHGIQPITQLLEEVGYYPCLVRSKKTDCNFATDKPLFRSDDWSKRPAGVPFFAQCTLNVTHRPFHRDLEHPVDPASVTLPSFYPDTPVVRRDWADGLESMQIADRQFGELLTRLKTEGLEENTVVILAADNGLCHARGKQFLYEAGIHVPLIIRWPNQIPANDVNSDLVSLLDVSATILAIAGVKPAVPLQGRDLLDGSRTPRAAIFSGRDKMDETHDAMRAVITSRYKLIHNLMPERPWIQRNKYKEAQYPVWNQLQLLNLQGKLPAAQALFMASRKPEYELFDLEKDPEELRNLADDPNLTSIKADLISRLQEWRQEIKDPGVNQAFREGGKDWEPSKDEQYWQEKLARFKKISPPGDK